MKGADASDDRIEVMGAPAIPGLRFRRFRGESDFPIIADVMQRSRDADLYDMVETSEDIAEDYRHLQNCDPNKDVLLVEVDGCAIGYCRCEWHARLDGVRTYEHWAHLVPEWRIEGLRQAMLRNNERRLLEIATEHIEDSQRFFETRANYAENDWKTVLEMEGYQPFRYNIVMLRPKLDVVPDIPLPGGIEVRPVQKEHHRLIWNAAGEAFRDEPNFAEEMWTDEGYKWASEWRAFRPEIWQVAWAGDEVAGAVLNVIEEEENKRFNRNWGYTMAIFVRRPYRNRGLASALIARSFGVLRKEGVSEAALMVDSENPSGAFRLYEKMGYHVHSQFTRYRKSLS